MNECTYFIQSLWNKHGGIVYSIKWTKNQKAYRIKVGIYISEGNNTLGMFVLFKNQRE